MDGDFITDAPQKLVQQGKVANVPFITGDCDDEGTLFGLANANITSVDLSSTLCTTILMTLRKQD